MAKQEPSTRLAQHEVERRRRMAASAGAPLNRTLAHATQALFQSVMLIDELATRAQGQPHGQVDGTSLRTLQDRMNDALQHCDQLAILMRHVQALLEPAARAPGWFDLRDLLSQASYCAHGLLPSGLVVVNRLPVLAPVQGEQAEIMQALIDALVQVGACADAESRLELHGGSEQGIVWVELRVTGAGGSPRTGLALESAIETLARHRGVLELPPSRDGSFTLRIRLPAAH